MTDTTISILGLIVSFIGLVISIITLYLAGTIKKAVKKANSEVLFNYKVDNIVKKLQAFNKEFISSYENIDERRVKNMLSDLRSVLTLLLPIVPSVHTAKCQTAITKCQKGYNSTFIKSNDIKKKWYKKYINIDYIWEVYNDVNHLIDLLKDIETDKNILK
ncbi:MAG TPA: hypothetical protein PKC55_12610 [Dysgonomonas sp.]|uniref:hypothetical protein n=1 Tax=unclassified Dysgonomonas TaxID=2630389 RepID=UPI0025BB1508|nr:MULTISPECIES: hypothetical protein [unclassified Dysgonomonas]HML65665.1 hypothetical protein [Dysgonomonas sp.]